MDAIEYLKVRSRMTNDCNISCDKCLLGYDKNSRGVSCSGLETNYPKEAIKVVEDWSKEHPIMTNTEKYKQLMKSILGDDFEIENCPNRSHDVPSCACDKMNDCSECEKFWNSEYKEKGEE